MSEESGSRAPRNAYFAIIASALLLAILVAVDQSARSCGDGLCGSIIGMLAMTGLVAATLFFTVRGLRRGEAPRWLFAIPAAVWLYLLPRLFF